MIISLVITQTRLKSAIRLIREEKKEGKADLIQILGMIAALIIIINLCAEL